MRMLRSRTLEGPPRAFNSCASLVRTFLYHSCCMAVSPTNSLVSFLGGRVWATSFLTRRSMNGLRTVWSFLMTFSCPSDPDMLNHSSNCSASPKISGRRKFSSAHNSWRLFWRGVPVTRRRNWVFMVRTTLLRDEFSFLILWASSMMRYFQSIFPNGPFSLSIPSYDVTSTSKVCFPVRGSLGRFSLTTLVRASLFPGILTALMDGHQCLISLIQFPSTDLGTTTMCGPLTPRDSRRYANRLMVWRVFPNPISSARTPLMPLSCNLIIQFSPSSW
mmetsp:Transcript_14522/g.42534  ORF Transcript_14522/g.42534 Transcript_14522/m.42534 type:complete len:275 (+) Transcript_14522:2256-3080(+)